MFHAGLGKLAVAFFLLQRCLVLGCATSKLHLKVSWPLITNNLYSNDMYSCSNYWLVCMFLFANFCGTNAEVEVENHPVLSQIRIFVNPCFFASLCQRWSCGDEVHGEICQSGPLWSKITTDQQWFPINIFCCCNFDILFGEKKIIWSSLIQDYHWSAVGSNKSLFFYIFRDFFGWFSI